MNHITRETAIAVRSEAQAALDEIFARHGLASPKISSRYGDVLRLTVEASSLNVDATTGVNLASKEAQAFNRYHSGYNLVAGALGVEFVSRGERYRFDGIATSRSKYPLAATKLVDGSRVFFTRQVAPTINAAAVKMAESL